MTVRVYGDDGALVWMGTVVETHPSLLDGRPLRLSLEVRDIEFPTKEQNTGNKPE